MKTVKMLKTAAGPERTLEEGKTYPLPDKQADELIAAEAAVEVHPQKQAQKPVEVAAIHPPEKAAQPAASKRRTGQKPGGKR